MSELSVNTVSDAVLSDDVRTALIAAAREAEAAAYAPYSNFTVGAAVLLSDGTIYKGCNVENASYGLTVCAERIAIFTAVTAGRMDIVAVGVSTSAAKVAKPCGACRQVISEFSRADSPIVVISTTQSGLSETETIADLLPGNFTLL